MTLGLPRAGGEAAGVTAALRVVGLSLGLGLLCGLVMIGLLRLLRGNYLLFVLACALVTVHLAHTLHLNDLLLAVTAGFVVSNFSPSGGVFRRGLEGAGAPVFLVFFCLAGAYLDVTELPKLGLLGMVYIVARSDGLIGGAILAWLYNAIVERAAMKDEVYRKRFAEQLRRAHESLYGASQGHNEKGGDGS